MTHKTQKKTVDSAKTLKKLYNASTQQTLFTQLKKTDISLASVSEQADSLNRKSHASILRKTSSAQTTLCLKRLLGKNSLTQQTRTLNLEHRKDVLKENFYQKKFQPRLKRHKIIVKSHETTVNQAEGHVTTVPAPACPQQL